MAKKKYKQIWDYKFKGMTHIDALKKFYEAHDYKGDMEFAISYNEGKLVGFEDVKASILRALRDHYIAYGIWLHQNELVDITEKKSDSKPLPTPATMRDKMYG